MIIMQNKNIFLFSKSGLTAIALVLFAELIAISQLVRAEESRNNHPSIFSGSIHSLGRNLVQGARINGEWDIQQAQQIVLPRLKSHNWGDNDPAEHIFLGNYKLPYRNKEARLVVTGSIRQGSDCHGCGPSLSFFEFDKRTRGWQLANSYIAAVPKWGTWGKSILVISR
jgi:hypothetical protein